MFPTFIEALMSILIRELISVLVNVKSLPKSGRIPLRAPLKPFLKAAISSTMEV